MSGAALEWRDATGALLAALRDRSALFFALGGHEPGRASLQLYDTFATQQIELGFYQYGCSLTTYTPLQATAPLEFMIYSGIFSIRNNNPVTPNSHRLEVRQPDDEAGINLESGYKKANVANLFGAYVYDDCPVDRPLFLQAYDGTGLYLQSGGMTTVGGRILPAGTRQLTRFLAADTASTSEIGFGWRNVPGSADALTWRLRLAAGGRKVGLVYDVSSEVVANGLYLTDDPRLGVGTNAPTARVDVRGSNENAIPLLALQPAAGQTAPLQEWRNASGGATAAMSQTSFLPPRLTTAQRDAIPSPVEGMLLYNTTQHKLNVYTTAWETVTSA